MFNVVKKTLCRCKKKISLIIPLFNSENYITTLFDTIGKIDYPQKYYEVIIIDDGSTDNSFFLARELAKGKKNIEVITKSNSGVSATRNVGIRRAKGKYIAFLDADDEISVTSIRECVSFFESVGDSCDLITYPIETEYMGRILPAHFRYNYLKESGVYDLCDNPFIGQTTMNIVVRNRFENNILFDESLSICEDQKYCCDILADKLKMGFCADAKYIYHRNPNSSSGKLAGACFMFESCMGLFEDIFARYEHVPMAFQGLFVNDIAWKLRSNIFWPYHYEREKFEKSVERVRNLLRKCYNYTILEHPSIDYFEKYYLLRLKGADAAEAKITGGRAQLWSEGYLVSDESSFEVVITKVKVKESKVCVDGFIKSVFFQFYEAAPKVFAYENDDKITEIPVAESGHDYYLSHEKTQRFWRIKYTADSKNIAKFGFRIRLGDCEFPVHYYFMQFTPFNPMKGICKYSNENIELELDETNTWNIRKICKVENDYVWLYYDCVGVEKDNGMIQFLHDCYQEDAIKRYYVVTDDRQRRFIPKDAFTVDFGSERHIDLLTKAEKIITAFIEENNIFPQNNEEVGYSMLSNSFHFEIIYVQHGVLHIDMPWKYSADRIQADYIVISTAEERELYLKNGYEDFQLIKAGMPRFSESLAVSRSEESNGLKILFAPSWRSYLAGINQNGCWELYVNKFLNSSYYFGMDKFLNNGILHELLREHNASVDVKLHPIFQDYRDYIRICSDKISFIDEVKIEDYDLLITDFSSILFDFLYKDIPILSFIPDYEEFRCGMNSYRDVDFLNKVDESFIATNSETIIKQIKEFFVYNKSLPYNVTFWNKDNVQKSTDQIYDFMINNTSCCHKSPI